jgi:hypothetical protein
MDECTDIVVLGDEDSSSRGSFNQQRFVARIGGRSAT